MENLSIPEALYALAAESSDATNIVARVRRAEARVREWLSFPMVDSEWHRSRPVDQVDSIIIAVSENGNIDIFA
ncbi:hypothetical protein IT882_13210 [Microbacterium schleiferi]|uniref:Uncharacterized protein n=1 Tax=Microbacterium schleiferi TaxID=69362 RepID=A0A7S8MX34_9MICO|nr:hypothetical protein [Microbacterium schleiferi]QPE04150.1 hypothetical protein IT882_13210 [Microbacterium schleiferi]